MSSSRPVQLLFEIYQQNFQFTPHHFKHIFSCSGRHAAATEEVDLEKEDERDHHRVDHVTDLGINPRERDQLTGHVINHQRDLVTNQQKDHVTSQRKDHPHDLKKRHVTSHGRGQQRKRTTVPSLIMMMM